MKTKESLVAGLNPLSGASGFHGSIWRFPRSIGLSCLNPLSGASGFHGGRTTCRSSFERWRLNPLSGASGFHGFNAISDANGRVDESQSPERGFRLSRSELRRDLRHVHTKVSIP